LINCRKALNIPTSNCGVEFSVERGQSDLARACNKGRQSIKKLENGKVNPTLYTLLEIANALGVSLSKSVDLS
jgi:transcriptional regulator with XRE-family HTH domain